MNCMKDVKKWMPQQIVMNFPEGFEDISFVRDHWLEQKRAYPPIEKGGGIVDTCSVTH